MSKAGSRWWCTAGHNGWQPAHPKVCPKCGARIGETKWREPTLKQYEVWVKTRGKT